MKTKILLFALGLSAAALPAETQSLNLDLGSEFGAPDPSFGAAAAQSGEWNSLGVGTWGLVDLAGAPIAATVEVDSFAVGHAGPGVTDAERLLGDNLLDCVDPDLWELRFSNLLDGLYDVYLYAPRNTLVSLGISNTGGSAAPSIEGDSFLFLEEQTYVRVPAVAQAGALRISSDATRENDCAGVAGVQLVYRGPAPLPIPVVNVDLGLGRGVPYVRYGAGAGQVGVWNAVGLGSHPLVDRRGVPTGITLEASSFADTGTASSSSNDPQRLLHDNILDCVEPNEWSVTLTGLQPDHYRIHLYAPANTLVETGEIDVNGIAVPSLPGNQSLPVQGVSWTSVDISTAGGPVTLRGSTAGTTCTGLAGLQIVSRFVFVGGFVLGDFSGWSAVVSD